MNEKKVLKIILKELNFEQVKEVIDILEWYVKWVNRTGKDTLTAKYMFINGYKNINDFVEKTKLPAHRCDTTLGQAIAHNTNNIKSYFKLKEILEIDDDDFIEILKEVGNNE